MVRWLGRKWSQSFVLHLYWQNIWFFRLCSIRSNVMEKFRFSRSRMQLLWAAVEMKIQNGRMKTKIMSILCAAFVLSIFLFVLHPVPNWGPKPLLYMVKIKNCPIELKMVSIVFSSFVLAAYVIFSLVLLSFSNSEEKPLVCTQWNFKCPIGAKMVSIVFASFVLEGCVIFSIVLPPGPTRGAKTTPIHSKNWK